MERVNEHTTVALPRRRLPTNETRSSVVAGKRVGAVVRSVTPGTSRTAKWGENGQRSVKPWQRPPGKTVGKPFKLEDHAALTAQAWGGKPRKEPLQTGSPAVALIEPFDCGGSMYSRATVSASERCHTPRRALKRCGCIRLRGACSCGDEPETHCERGFVMPRPHRGHVGTCGLHPDALGFVHLRPHG